MSDPGGQEMESALTSLSKLKLGETNEQSFKLSTSEFYYNLNLPAAEALSAAKNIRLPSEPSSKKPKSKKRKKSEKSADMDLKLQKARQNLNTLKITVPNDSRSALSRRKLQSTNEEVNPLLQRLVSLQKGTITSDQLLNECRITKNKPSMGRDDTRSSTSGSLKSSSKERPISKSTKPVSKSDEFARKKKEIQDLNRQIQSKIEQKLKPKLVQVLSHPTSSVPSGLMTTRPISRPTREIPIQRTKIKENDEIFRYSKDDLNQLKSTATWEVVPRLIDLNISVSTMSSTDILLVKILKAKNEQERIEIILNEAESRKLIRRASEFKFDFRQVEFKESKQSKKTKDDKNICDIEELKKTSKSADELNEAVYQNEFLAIFESAMDENIKKLSLAEMVNYIVNNSKANIIEGEIRVNSKNNQEAFVPHSKGSRDVYVPSIVLRKYAFHGDFVRVICKEVDEEDTSTDFIDLSEPETVLNKRNIGCVLEILEKRHSRRVIGSLSSTFTEKKRNVLLNVRDTKIPSVRLGRDGLPQDQILSDKMLMVAEITGWNLDQPKGRVVEIIGTKGDLKAENASILIQNNLDPKPYSKEIIDKLPAQPFVIPEAEFKIREDLRKKCIFSIDPESARDLDDALSCEILENGNLEIGVHISDVSYFLKEGSVLDNIVKEKATTIYLVDNVYHMLPVPLCLLCSLLPGTDKMAYSVFWEMNSAADILNTRFTRSIVNSCAKLNYDQAQAVIEGSDIDFPEIFNGFSFNDIANVILNMQNLAVILRQKRKDCGSLKIDQPKISFKFDKNDDRMEAPIDFFQYPVKDSNRLIEEFMLLANISVATFIYEKFPEVSLLRRHESPNESTQKKLVKTLKMHGVEVDLSSSSSISKSLEKLSKNAGMNAALNLLVSKTMARAKYFCSSSVESQEEFRHYALSTPIYTHFTSPIRRYADVLVHRVLNAALGYEDPPSRSAEEIQQLAEVCNAQKYAAKLAGDDSSNLYFLHFIRSLKSKVMLCSVLGVFQFNLEVVLVETGHVLKMYYKNLQQNDEIVIKPFIEDSPPHVSFIFPKLESPPMKIKFGSELLVKLEVLKDKLVINKMFYHDAKL